jgi:hypothetical protein
MSITLLSTVLEKIIRNMEINRYGTIFNRMRQYISRANDVVIFEWWVRANEQVVRQLKEATLRTG